MHKLPLLLAGGALAIGAYAGDLTSVKKAVDQKAAEYAKAVKAKDIGWFEKSADPGLVVIDKAQKSDLKRTLIELKQLFQMMKSIDMVSSKVVSIKMVGKSAVVVTTTHMEGKMVGPNGKTSKLVDISKDQETWVPAGKDWKVKEIRMISDKATMDGKAAPGM